MEFNGNAGIDLHIHSTASDGTLSPSEILSVARSSHLGAIAITDHDTINGSKEALKIGIPSSLKFLTGVEISATPPPVENVPGSCHILGYNIDLENKRLNESLKVLQGARKSRNPQIIKRLNSLGLKITINDVLKEVGEGQVGRPHIAKAMITKGYVHTINEAFDKYLAQGKPAYQDKYRMDCSEAIHVITAAGGIPVLAHPFLLGLQSREIFRELVARMTEMGLKGIEVYYPEHPPDETIYYSKLAKQYGLFMTGGTDFHGSLKPDIKMGFGKGDFFVPFSLYEQLVSF